MFQSCSILKQMPDQKRQSLGQWDDYVENNSSFPKAVDISLSMHSFGFLVWKFFFFLNGKGQRRGEGAVLPLFFLYLFIYCYLLWLFCWHFVRPIQGRDSVAVMPLFYLVLISLTRSCIALKILAQHLHVPKRLSWAACLLLVILPQMHSLHI